MLLLVCLQPGTKCDTGKISEAGANEIMVKMDDGNGSLEDG